MGPKRAINNTDCGSLRGKVSSFPGVYHGKCRSNADEDSSLPYFNPGPGL